MHAPGLPGNPDAHAAGDRMAGRQMAHPVRAGLAETLKCFASPCRRSTPAQSSNKRLIWSQQAVAATPLARIDPLPGLQTPSARPRGCPCPAGSSPHAAAPTPTPTTTPPHRSAACDVQDDGIGGRSCPLPSPGAFLDLLTGATGTQRVTAGSHARQRHPEYACLRGCEPRRVTLLRPLARTIVRAMRMRWL
jgi:hypothetical protein